MVYVVAEEASMLFMLYQIPTVYICNIAYFTLFISREFLQASSPPNKPEKSKKFHVCVAVPLSSKKKGFGASIHLALLSYARNERSLIQKENERSPEPKLLKNF